MRLFFGLSLPDEIRAATAECALRAAQQIPGRYTLSENHHITLAFLGDVPDERLVHAQSVLDHCLSSCFAPRLTLDGFSHFGRTQNGILILRVQSDPPLGPLHDALIHALQETGLPADPGPFSPHITLARHAQIGSALPECPPLGFTPDCAHVYLSARDKHNTLRYTPLHTVSFLK